MTKLDQVGIDVQRQRLLRQLKVRYIERVLCVMTFCFRAVPLKLALFKLFVFLQQVVTKRAYARILEVRPSCTLEMEKVTHMTTKLDETLHACRYLNIISKLLISIILLLPILPSNGYDNVQIFST